MLKALTLLLKQHISAYTVSLNSVYDVIYGVRMSAELNVVSNPTDLEDLIVTGQTFIFKEEPETQNDVLIGATAAETAQNLVAVINGNSSVLCTAGTDGTSVYLTAKERGEAIAPSLLLDSGSGSLTVASQWTGAAGLGKTRPDVVEIQSASANLTQAHSGKIIVAYNDDDPVTLTLTGNFPAGFNCVVIQTGAQVVTIDPDGQTLVNRQSQFSTAGENAVISLIAKSANNIVLAGDTA